jgi:hypothetical protein
MNESKIEKQAIVQGLNEPLEFLSDIEIDAPLAGSLLALIVSQFLKWDIVDLDFLLSAPKSFLTDGNPSVFGRKVLEKRGGVPTDIELGVLDMLDKKKANERGIRNLKREKRRKEGTKQRGSRAEPGVFLHWFHHVAVLFLENGSFIN